MIPILYKANETDFSHCGIGVLSEATACTVTEERNGAFECEFKYPIDGRLFGEIQESCIIKAKPNETSDPQLFRIYASSKPINGIVTYRAEHISYELSGYPVESVSVENVTANTVMSAVLNATLIAHRYTAQSDIDLLKSTTIDRKSARAALGGVEGSVLSLWGGEFEFDNFTVKLHKARGRRTGIKIAYGKNITDIKQEASIAEVYTAVYPYATYSTQPTDGQTEPEEITVSLPEKILYSQKAAKTAGERVCIKDFSESFGGATEITVEQLRAKAQNWVETSGFDVPLVNITVSFENLWQSPEYEQYALLERCGLCDTVSVEFPALNISTTAKIIKTKYDVLNEKYLQITLGSARANFADTVKDTSAAIEQTKQEIKQSSAKVEVDFKKAIDSATKAITGQSGGYVVLNPEKNPQEILIMDAPTITAAKRIWRWNGGGLGYSQNGYNGPFETAITQDGAIVADFITVGQIATARLDVRDIIRTGGIAVLGDVTAEAERATEEEGKLSSRIAATADEINAEVARATTAEGTLSSRITANATEIAAKVSSTGGAASSFAWSLTASGFVLTANNAEVMRVTSSGLSVAGNITAESGEIGGFTIGSSSIYKTKRTFDSLTEGVYIGIDGIGLGAGTFYVTDTGKVCASDVEITGGSIVLGSLSTNYYNKIDSSGIQIGGYDWYNIRLAYGSLTLSADQWAMGDPSTLRLGFFGGADTGVSSFGIEAQLSNTEDFYIVAHDKETGLYGVGMTMRARSSSAYGELNGTWRSSSSIIVTSDRNAKNSITDIDEKYNTLFDGLRARLYKYNNGTSGRLHSGFVAQEVEEAMRVASIPASDFAAFCVDGAGTDKEQQGLRYEEFVSLNTWQIQKLKAHLQEMERRLAILEKPKQEDEE